MPRNSEVVRMIEEKTIASLRAEATDNISAALVKAVERATLDRPVHVGAAKEKYGLASLMKR